MRSWTYSAKIWSSDGTPSVVAVGAVVVADFNIDFKRELGVTTERVDGCIGMFCVDDGTRVLRGEVTSNDDEATDMDGLS